MVRPTVLTSTTSTWDIVKCFFISTTTNNLTVGSKFVQGPDAELGLLYTGLISGLLGVAMESGVSKEPFFVTLCPDKLDDPTK
jgi:hypothetical protein